LQDRTTVTLTCRGAALELAATDAALRTITPRIAGNGDRVCLRIPDPPRIHEPGHFAGASIMPATP